VPESLLIRVVRMITGLTEGGLLFAGFSSLDIGFGAGSRAHYAGTSKPVVVLKSSEDMSLPFVGEDFLGIRHLVLGTVLCCSGDIDAGYMKSIGAFDSDL